MAETENVLYFEGSAKTGEGVREAFSELIINAIRLRVCPPLKDIYMTFLLWLNEDFDDDLLQDAMELTV